MDEKSQWIEECTRKISNAIGGGSELFTRHGDDFRLDIDFVCKRILDLKESKRDAFSRAIKSEKEASEIKLQVRDKITLLMSRASGGDMKEEGFKYGFQKGLMVALEQIPPDHSSASEAMGEFCKAAYMER